MSGGPFIWSYGIAMMDVLVHPLDAWPQRGQLVLSQDGRFIPGGVALNTAVTAARLGGRVGLIASVGLDPAADGVLSFLRAEGVDTRLVVRSKEETTGFCIVAVGSDGEKSLIAHLGANRGLTPDRIDWRVVEPGSLLHIGGCFAVPELSGEPLAATLTSGRARGCKLFLESAWDVTGRWLHGVEPFLPSLDAMMTSANEAEGMTGDADPAQACRTLAAMGPKTVVVKAGEHGCFVWVEGSVRHFPAYDVRVVDATGAGDSFCGGFLAVLARGWDVPSAARFATAVAAMNVTAMGSVAGVSDMEATLVFMDSAHKRVDP
jgi:sugar/nucleoside kinase (ribokinase family)